MERSIFNDDFPLAQFGLTILVSLSCLIISFLLGFLAAIPMFHIHPYELYRELENFNNVPLQKYFQVIQAIGLFIAPAFILSKLFSGQSLSYLKLDRPVKGFNIALVFIIMITSLPVINLLVQVNSEIRLPEFLSGLQQKMESSSRIYEKAAETFLQVSTFPGLLLNIFIIALLPALGEELFFRGLIQRIFTNMFKNVHVGIILTGFIFSVLHMEFYGFFPRWALGVMFGYMLVWSGTIWLPVLAHFINNTFTVIASFLINNRMTDKSIDNFGTTADVLPFTIISGIIMAAGLYYLFRKNSALNYEQPTKYW